MKASKFQQWWLLIGLFVAVSISAAEQLTEHTLRLEKGAIGAAAKIEDAAWLAGAWEGEAFGGRFEEVWNPPSAQSMVGMFKVFDDQGIKFYELMVIQEEQGSLVMKVKHFSADFTAWEEKADYVRFPLVQHKLNELHFAGLSFRRKGDDAITVHLVMTSKHGQREERLEYRRVQ